ncbi:MAG: dTMP kinase [Gemmatimonadota bacterium]|nr:dTMP kinase [Gemmatimonadota bacterium]
MDTAPDRPPDGLLITFEGGEGSGKSTQLERLAGWLEEEGHAVTMAREPGTTATGEAVRRILLETAPDDLVPQAEFALFLAARAQLAEEVVRPALEEGRVVLLDRYGDSSTAYQGYGRGLDPREIARLNRWATHGLEPDLTVLIDVAVEEGAARRGDREPDRLERLAPAFHERVRRGYRELARNHPDRFVVIPGERSIDEIQETIRERVRDRLSKRTPQAAGSSDRRD